MFESFVQALREMSLMLNEDGYIFGWIYVLMMKAHENSLRVCRREQIRNKVFTLVRRAAGIGIRIRIRGDLEIPDNRAEDISRSPLTCSLSRCPWRRGGCRSLRGGGNGGGGGDGCCPTNWNWPSHRSYSRPAPGPEDGPSPENDDARPSWIVSS